MPLPTDIFVWVDDVRDAPTGWTRASTAAEAIRLLDGGVVVELSLGDHLGDEAKYGNGHDVCLWIEEAVATRGFVPPAIRVHAKNVLARERMQRVVDSIERMRGTGAA